MSHKARAIVLVIPPAFQVVSHPCLWACTLHHLSVPGHAASALRAPAKKRKKIPEGAVGRQEESGAGAHMAAVCVWGGGPMMDGKLGWFPGNCVCPRSCVADSDTEGRKWARGSLCVFLRVSDSQDSCQFCCPPTRRSGITPEVKLSKAHANDPGQVWGEKQVGGWMIEQRRRKRG